MNLFTIVILSITVQNYTVLDTFFRIITELGSEYFYMVVVPPIFWCINKKFGFRLLLISSLAAYITTVFKNIFKVPRPPPEHWKTEPESFAFPSGHVHGSTTLWLYIMHWTRRKFFVVLGIVIIILVAVSRVYLGVHYPGDVYAGIALGVVTLVVFLLFEPKLTGTINTWQFEHKLLLGTIIPLILLFYSSLFFTTDPHGVKLAGALFGIIPGYILEDEIIKISVKVSNKVKFLRIILGLFIAFTLYFGLSWILPFNILNCFITAWLGGFSVMFISPWVFSKLEPKMKAQI